jgi:hypothetical protein
MSTNEQSNKVTAPTDEMVAEWVKLLTTLQGAIGDDYRASDDPDDETPGMQVTFGFTPEDEDTNASWSYQTGDNSYTGGAYGHPFWGVVSLYRDSDPAKVAEDAASEIAEQVAIDS